MRVSLFHKKNLFLCFFVGRVEFLTGFLVPFRFRDRGICLIRQSQETASSSTEGPGDLPVEAVCQAKDSGSEHIDQAPQPSDPPPTDNSKASEACDEIEKEKSTDAVAEGEALAEASPLPLGAILVFYALCFFFFFVASAGP